MSSIVKKTKFNKKFKKNVKVVFWCIDLRYYVALVRFRIDELRKEIQKEVRTTTQKEYWCEKCHIAFEITEVMVRGRNTLQCPTCTDRSTGVPRPVLVVPNPHLAQNKIPLPVLLEQQLRPLLDALRRINFPLPRTPSKKVIDWDSEASFVPLPVYFLEKGNEKEPKSFEVIVHSYPHLSAPIPIFNKDNYLLEDVSNEYQYDADKMVKALPPWMRSALKDAKESFHMEQHRQRQELEELRSNLSKQRVAVVAVPKDPLPDINNEFFNQYIPLYLTEFWRQIEGFDHNETEN